jgi:glycosyltransferase involved in cell wall biosynthesis
MRIGIDISTVLNHGKDIGSGRYIVNLIKNLIAINKEDTFVLTARYTDKQYLDILDELKSTCFNPVLEINNKKNVKNEKEFEEEKLKKDKYKDKKGRLEFKLFQLSQKKLDLWNKLHFPPLEMLGFSTDIFHCPDFLIPPTTNKNIILTIHDLAFIRFPHFNFEWFVKKYTKEVRRNAAIAKRIIAVSQSTKKDIMEFFKTSSTKIDVIYEAADTIFKKLSENEINRSLLEKYKITKKFLLSVGTIEPRKNYVTLIKAFNFLKNCHLNFNHQLVIIGRTGWMSETAYAEYENSPFKNDIIFAGRVSDSELVHMYNMAELFVYPSIFEGFGLPLIEALQCGLPAIASKTSSIPEIVDAKKCLFNPADEKEIAEKINLVLNNEELKKELCQKAIKNAAKFNWRLTAEKTLDAYKKSLQ